MRILVRAVRNSPWALKDLMHGHGVSEAGWRHFAQYGSRSLFRPMWDAVADMADITGADDGIFVGLAAWWLRILADKDSPTRRPAARW